MSLAGLMYDRSVRERALDLHVGGAPLAQIARLLAVNRSTIRDWLADPVRALQRGTETCWRHGGTCADPAAYAYLLGQYLGDGCLSEVSRTPRLRIICANDYPVIQSEVTAAILAVSGKTAGAVPKTGCREVYAYWNHWPCLFPQHGPGLKHRRLIALADWQQEVVRAYPRELVRGLIHSDGCRSMNNVTVRGRRYSYPRYFFSNESADIRSILTDALDRLGIDWRANRVNSISIARKASVAALDEFIGPKT